MRCKISTPALYALDGQVLLLLSASPFVSMMPEVPIDQICSNCDDVHDRAA